MKSVTYMYYYVQFCIILRLDATLRNIEQVNGIHTRPTASSSEYARICYEVSDIRSQKLKSKIAVLARERWFLLALKAKFAGTLLIIYNTPKTYLIDY